MTRVYLDLSDFRRTVTVEGTSPEQVDAIFGALREDLALLSSPIGGSMVKTFLGAPAYWLLVMVIGWAVPTWQSRRSPSSLAVVFAAASIILLLAVLPVSDLLAGFLAIRGDPSFMIRYGPQISFLGLVLAVVVVPLSVIPMVKAAQTERKSGLTTALAADPERFGAQRQPEQLKGPEDASCLPQADKHRQGDT